MPSIWAAEVWFAIPLVDVTALKPNKAMVAEQLKLRLVKPKLQPKHTFLNKNIVFPAETEYSHSSASFLWMFLHYNARHLCVQMQFWRQPAGFESWYGAHNVLQKCSKHPNKASAVFLVFS